MYWVLENVALRQAVIWGDGDDLCLQLKPQHDGGPLVDAVRVVLGNGGGGPEVVPALPLSVLNAPNRTRA